MVKVALQNNVRMIAGGYIGGQVPKDAAMIELDLSFRQKTQDISLSKLKSFFGVRAEQYFNINKSGFSITCIDTIPRNDSGKILYSKLENN